ncbi:hypothetical protein WJX79_005232 [Trebouxia sp. C0005]
MEATLSFNACHVRWTLKVQHSVRRLTSYRHELQQGAKCRHRRSCATVCSSTLGNAYSINDSTGTIPQLQGQQPDEAGADISLLAESLQVSKPVACQEESMYVDVCGPLLLD